MIVTRKELADRLHVSLKTIERRLPEIEFVGNGPIPPGMVKVHQLPGKGSGYGYDLTEVMRAIAIKEATGLWMRSSNRWKSANHNWQLPPAP